MYYQENVTCSCGHAETVAMRGTADEWAEFELQCGEQLCGECECRGMAECRNCGWQTRADVGARCQNCTSRKRREGDT